MEFRVLGPLEVVRQGRPVALGTGKERTLLAALLLHANEVVSTDRLIDAIWGERAPATAPKIVQGYVSHLRKLLGAGPREGGRDGGVLVTRAPGYLLRLEEGQLDVDRFTTLLAKGRAALAADAPLDASMLLEEALGLWRGPPLAEFAFDPFAQDEILRLEELRLAALEERADADLALGRHGGLVAELEALVARHPLRERPRGQLMLALYRCGRQAEALQAYQDTRRVLVDELGIEPSRTIVELEQAILRQDPSLDLPPAAVPPPLEPARTTPVQSRAPERVFVGRERELDVLLRALEDACSGRGRLVLVGGEPGIGKSRLAEELAAAAAAKGAEIHWGRCWEEGGAPPYWPWVQVLRASVQERSADQLAGELGAGAPEVAELVTDVRAALPGLAAPAALDPQQARFRLFDAIAGFLKRAGRSRPLVLVVDDLNWADEGSLRLLEFVARELVDAHVLLVGTYRDIGLSRHHPFARTLGELSRERPFERVLLRGLPHGDVDRFVAAACGFQPDEGLVQAIRAQTEGNPFFVGEVVRLLREEGFLTPDAAGTRERWSARIPDGVREAIGRRLDRLSRPCVSTLTVASAIGREFALDQLELLVDDLDADELLETLDEALDARVVEELPGASRYQFTHALIQATLADELSRTRQARLHARIAHALEGHYGDRAVDHAAELAHHFGEAEAVLGADGLVRYSALAGEAALAAHAPEQALAHFERALAANGNEVVDDQAAELLFGLGRAQVATLPPHKLEPAIASLRRAFDHYAASGDVGRAAAIAAYPLPLSLRFGYTDAEELIRQGLALVSSGAHEAGAVLAQHAWFTGFIESDYNGAQRAFRQALSIARRDGDAALERRTLANAAFVDAFHLRWQDCLEKGLRAVELAQQAGDTRTEIPARRALGFALVATGEREQARVHTATALALAKPLRESWWLTSSSFSNELLCLYEGDWRAARELGELGLAAEPGDPRHLALRAVLEYELGDGDEGAAYLARLREVAESVPPPGPIADHIFVAAVIPLIGRIAGSAEALRSAERAAQRVLSLLPRLTPALTLYARSGLGLIAVERGDANAAERLYGELAAARGTASFFVPLAADRLLGLVAAAHGRLDAAAAHFADGLAFCARTGYRPQYAWTACDFAELLARRGAEGDQAKAEALQDEALAVARDLGMRPLAARVAARRELSEA